jgi:hypothetical protein
MYTNSQGEYISCAVQHKGANRKIRETALKTNPSYINFKKLVYNGTKYCLNLRPSGCFWQGTDKVIQKLK